MSESRIIVTQKGRQLQKELSGEKRNESKILFSPSPSNTRASFRVKKHYSSTEKSNPALQFNTTLRSRSGYFGSKALLKEVRDSLANYKPPYYPNYLRRSQDEYPSAHFDILTPEKVLKDSKVRYYIPNKHPLVKEQIAEPTETTIQPDERLPMRYIHHTLFPQTILDKPLFLKRTRNANSMSLMQTQGGFFENGSSRQRQNSIPDSPNRSNMHITTSENFYASHISHKNNPRLDDFQKTLYNENNTIVTEHYSKQVVNKYDDRKLSKIRQKHSVVQKQFRELLGTIEETYQKKLVKAEDNMNVVPEFQEELRRNNSIFDTRDQKKNNESLRLIERLSSIQKQRYSNSWYRFGSLGKPALNSKETTAQSRMNTELVSRGGSVIDNSTIKQNVSWAPQI